MKAIILAAGYATRLYPITLNKSKCLLPIAGKPMIQRVVESIIPIKEIDEFYVVTNGKFADDFADWANGFSKQSDVKITVINDKSTDDSNKLGAIGDLALVLNTRAISDNVIVVAGDNLFSESLEDFGKYCRGADAAVIGVYDVKNIDEVSKYSAIELDENNRVINFVEKPKNPSTTKIGIALYYYPAKVIPLIHRYIAEGNNKDQPGRLIQWLYTRTPVYGWLVPGLWYDIGDKNVLDAVQKEFSEIDKKIVGLEN